MVNTLTKNNNLKKVNKKSVINLISDPNINIPEVLDNGLLVDFIPKEKKERKKPLIIKPNKPKKIKPPVFKSTIPIFDPPKLQDNNLNNDNNDIIDIKKKLKKVPKLNPPKFIELNPPKLQDNKIKVINKKKLNEEPLLNEEQLIKIKKRKNKIEKLEPILIDDIINNFDYIKELKKKKNIK
jgi:hypothetical protein